MPAATSNARKTKESSCERQEQNSRVFGSRPELPTGGDEEDESGRFAHGDGNVRVFAVERDADEVEEDARAVQKQNNLGARA